MRKIQVFIESFHRLRAGGNLWKGNSKGVKYVGWSHFYCVLYLGCGEHNPSSQLFLGEHWTTLKKSSDSRRRCLGRSRWSTSARPCGGRLQYSLAVVFFTYACDQWFQPIEAKGNRSHFVKRSKCHVKQIRTVDDIVVQYQSRKPSTIVEYRHHWKFVKFWRGAGLQRLRSPRTHKGRLSGVGPSNQPFSNFRSYRRPLSFLLSFFPNSVSHITYTICL